MLSVSEIDVARDIMTCVLVVNSYEKPKKLDFSIDLTEWTPLNMKMKADFNFPPHLSVGKL
jgi:hypothetical protein